MFTTIGVGIGTIFRSVKGDSGGAFEYTAIDNNFSMAFEQLSKHKDIDAVIYVPLNGRSGDGLKIEKWCKENKIRAHDWWR